MANSQFGMISKAPHSWGFLFMGWMVDLDMDEKNKDTKLVSTIINVCIVIVIICVIYNFYTGKFSF